MGISIIGHDCFINTGITEWSSLLLLAQLGREKVHSSAIDHDAFTNKYLSLIPDGGSVSIDSKIAMELATSLENIMGDLHEENEVSQDSHQTEAASAIFNSFCGKVGINRVREFIKILTTGHLIIYASEL